MSFPVNYLIIILTCTIICYNCKGSKWSWRITESRDQINNHQNTENPSLNQLIIIVCWKSFRMMLNKMKREYILSYSLWFGQGPQWDRKYVQDQSRNSNNKRGKAIIQKNRINWIYWSYVWGSSKCLNVLSIREEKP